MDVDGDGDGDIGVDVWMWCGFVVVELAGSPTTLASAHTGSLNSNNIGDAGAQDLGAVLQINTTLTTL
jgi:hypothetical protein